MFNVLFAPPVVAVIVGNYDDYAGDDIYVGERLIAWNAPTRRPVDTDAIVKPGRSETEKKLPCCSSRT